MINKDGIKLKTLWRTLFVLTIAIPQFISLSTMSKMLSNDSGVLANVYQTLTGVPLNFAHPRDLASNGLVTKIIIIVVNIWVGIPYTILSTTGILLNIPKDLYESSRIDGAGPSTQFFKITMPYILFVTGPSLITSFIGNFNNFGVIFFLSGGNPKKTTGSAIAPGTTDLFITYIYRLVTDDVNKYYNVASAIGIIIFLVCSFISIIMYNKTGAVAKEDQFQ
jgi:arabinogalactan oligomer/maltooligosaccharide transport system permease protein